MTLLSDHVLVFIGVVRGMADARLKEADRMFAAIGLRNGGVDILLIWPDMIQGHLIIVADAGIICARHALIVDENAFLKLSSVKSGRQVRVG